MYCTVSDYKTLEKSDKPISTCLLDQMKNDAKFSNKNTRIGEKRKDINKVFETLKSFEPWLHWDSTAKDVTQFLEKASNLLQRKIKVVNLKGGEQVLKFNSATNIQAEPYHLCFVHNEVPFFDALRNQRRGWLSITCKNVRNTAATQIEPDLENKPDLNKTRPFSQVLNFFQK